MIFTKEQTEELMADLTAQEALRREKSAQIVSRLIAETAAITAPEDWKGSPDV